MAILSGNVIFINSVNYLFSGDIYGSGIFCGSSVNANSIATGYFYNQSVNSGFLFEGTFSGNSFNCGVILNNAMFMGNSQNRQAVKGRGIFNQSSINSGCLMQAIFNDNSVNYGHVSGDACFSGNAINSGTVSGQICYATNAKDWTRTSAYLPMYCLHSRELPDKFAVNFSGTNIILKKDDFNYAAYSLTNNMVDGYLSWNQIGANILNCGDFVDINAAGNRVAIAHAYDENSCGAVTVYDFIQNNWQQFNQKIINPNTIRSVSLNHVGDRIAVGMPQDVGYNNSFENGAVKILCWSNEYNEWDSVGYSLIHGENGEKIGKSVKLNQVGDRVVFTTKSGFKVYQAQNVARPTNPDVIDICWYQMGSSIYLPNANQYTLGFEGLLGKVSINGGGDKILVSQFRQLQDYSLSGVVAAYCWSGNSWNQMGDLLSSQRGDDYFGLDLQMNSLGDKIIIGSNGSPSGDYLLNKGKASIYDWNGSNWSKNNYDLGKDDLHLAETQYGQQVSIAPFGNVVYATRNVISGGNVISQVSQYKILN